MTAQNPLRSFRFLENGTKIEIVNQLLLPHTVEWLEIITVDDCYDAIKSMKIRGAPAIASLAALWCAVYLNKALLQQPSPPFLESHESLTNHLAPLLARIYTARPTAVNLGAATRRLITALESPKDEPRVVAQRVVIEAVAINEEDFSRNTEMSKRGGEWLIDEVKRTGASGKGLNVLTVCNTGSLATSGYGTALGLITYLHETGNLGRAYFTQTAPYHQGSRLTALELQTLKIPCTMICDTMVGSLFQQHNIHAVVVGADRIAKNGDTANKIGTYNAAVLAAWHHIPFIVVAPVATVDVELADGIPIEQRPGIEACVVRGALQPPTPLNEQAVVMLTPPGLDVYNPSFDVTPSELISAVVTERGLS